MSLIKSAKLLLGVSVAALGMLLSLSIACAAKETAGPASTATPTPRVAPALTPTAVPAPAPSPTPTQVAMEKPHYGGTLRYVFNLNLKSLDTPFETSTAYLDIRHGLFNSVVGIDEELRVVPQLGRSWEVSTDGKSITMQLVKGAKFHDGTDVNAQAVKWNFDRHMDKQVASRHGADLSPVLEGVSVKDDYTVVFHLKKPHRPFLANIYEYAGDIHSPTAVQKLNSYANRTGDYGKNPVGTGPFRFKEWLPDSHVILQRFDGYWESGKPYLDVIVYQHVPDATVQLAMVRTGETDVIGFVDAKDIPLVRRNPSLKVAELSRGRFHSIGISPDVAPWSNKNLRASFAYAVDRKTLAETYYLGQAEPAYSPIAVGWGYNPTIKVYDYDPKMAKQKLAEAGYPSGVTLTYPCSSTTASLQLCEILQAQFKAVGINMEIQTILAADFWSTIVNRKTHLANRWRGPRADPGRFLEQIFQTKGSGNVMGYSNPEVDRLLEEAGTIYDIAQAKKAYDRIQLIVTEEVPHVLTVYTKEFTVVNRRVQGYVFIPDLYLRVKDLWLSK